MRFPKPGHTVLTEKMEDGHVISFNWGQTGKCFDCGGKATAVWRGSVGWVEVCGGCATSTLPALIADAVHHNPHRGLSDFLDTLAKVASVFWRAVASRLAADLNPRSSDREGSWSEPEPIAKT